MRILGACSGARAAGLALLLWTTGTSSVAAGSSYPPPPYMIAEADLIMIAITLDEAAVRGVLPDGIEPVEGVTGGINVYRSQSGYGLGPYSAGYIWADVEGFESPDGTNGRWILKAVHGPAAHVSEAIRNQYGIPTITGSAQMALDSEAARGTALLDGKPIADVAVTMKSEECGPAAGALYYPSIPPGGDGVVVNEIPWAGQFCPAEVNSIEIQSSAGQYFEGLAPTSVIWAGVLRQVNASFSRPNPAN